MAGMACCQHDCAHRSTVQHMRIIAATGQPLVPAAAPPPPPQMLPPPRPPAVTAATSLQTVSRSICDAHGTSPDACFDQCVLGCWVGAWWLMCTVAGGLSSLPLLSPLHSGTLRQEIIFPRPLSPSGSGSGCSSSLPHSSCWPRRPTCTTFGAWVGGRMGSWVGGDAPLARKAGGASLGLHCQDLAPWKAGPACVRCRFKHAQQVAQVAARPALTAPVLARPAPGGHPRSQRPAALATASSPLAFPRPPLLPPPILAASAA